MYDPKRVNRRIWSTAKDFFTRFLCTELVILFCLFGNRLGPVLLRHLDKRADELLFAGEAVLELGGAIQAAIIVGNVIVFSVINLIVWPLVIFALSHLAGWIMSYHVEAILNKNKENKEVEYDV